MRAEDRRGFVCSVLAKAERELERDEQAARQQQQEDAEPRQEEERTLVLAERIGPHPRAGRWVVAAFTSCSLRCGTRSLYSV